MTPLSKSILLIYLFTLSVSNIIFAQTPPYAGTIFLNPNILTSSDVSTIQSTTYTGYGTKTVFDRRTNNWETISAYLFDVIWNDGLTSQAVVNAEVGSLAAADVEAQKYGFLIGQLPYCLRIDVNEIWIHRGTQPFGGGNNSILIHTGQSASYEASGVIEETLIHEACHTSMDYLHAATSGWTNAQYYDGNYISTYGRDNPTREDLAESFLTWMAIRYRATVMSASDITTINNTIPNRIIYFDNQSFNMSPIVTPLSIEDETISLQKFDVYPNPTNGIVKIRCNYNFEQLNVTIFDINGKRLFNKEYNNTSIPELNTSTFSKGIYIMQLETKERKINFKLIVE